MLIDLEISLVRAFGWPLAAIDETAIESLLPFVSRFGRTAAGSGAAQVYCDQVDWL